MTAKERQFQRQIRAIEKSWQTERNVSLRRVAALARAYENEIKALIGQAGHTEWKLHHLGQLEVAMRQAAVRAESLLEMEWQMSAEQAAKFGVAGVDDPLRGIMPDMPTAPHYFDDREMFLALEFVPSLIKDVCHDAREQTAKALRLAVMGQATTPELIRAVEDATGKLGWQAERITRTEMNRLHNMVTEHRISELAERAPGLGKMWLHRPSPNPRPGHEQLHGTVIYSGEKFDVNGYEADGPHDPSLPAEETINCHCTVVAYFDETRQAAVQEDVPAHGVLLAV